MLSKIKFLFILIIISLILSSCYNNDDWAPYTQYSKSLDVSSITEVKSISDIIPEINKIAEKYAQGIILTEITLTLIGNDQINKRTGDLHFIYAKTNDSISQITKIDLYFNMENKKIYKMEYEQGHGKRVRCVTDPIKSKYISLPISDLISKFSENQEYISAKNNIKPELIMNFWISAMNAYVYSNADFNGTPDFKYEIMQ